VVSFSLRGRAAQFALVIAAICCFSPASFAALLVEFKSLPISPSDPEVRWSVGGLVAAPTANGSQGNGDGLNPIGSQSVGGLIIETPVTLNRSDLGGSVNLGNGGSTTFSDVTLILSNLNSTGNAGELNGLLDQPIGGGAFKLQSTSQAVGGPVDLLVGTIATGDITGIKNSDSGSVLSGNVTYTGGLIADALNSALGHAIGTPIPGGSLAFSLLDIDNKLTLNTAGTRLNDFSANSTGQFGTPVVPEPASLSLLAIGACGILIRRRK
jgi:hypothetical protein